MLAVDVFSGLESTPAIAAGIAAATVAVLRVPFTAVLLASLLVGSSATDVAPIVVLAAATGWLVAMALPETRRTDPRRPSTTRLSTRPAPDSARGGGVIWRC
jgi:hypothetical protein